MSFLILLCKEIDTILTDYAPTFVEKETPTIETLFLIMSMCVYVWVYVPVNSGPLESVRGH